MEGIIRLGDPTTSGGKVIEATSMINVAGLPAARKGDRVFCPIPLHGVNPIIEGNELVCDQGIPIAFHGHRLSCGCRLLSTCGNVRTV